VRCSWEWLYVIPGQSKQFSGTDVSQLRTYLSDINIDKDKALIEVQREVRTLQKEQSGWEKERKSLQAQVGAMNSRERGHEGSLLLLLLLLCDSQHPTVYPEHCSHLWSPS